MSLHHQQLVVRWLGQVDYTTAWEYQKTIVEQVGRGEQPQQLLLLEHPPTYTFGRKGRADHLLLTDQQQAEQKIATYWVDRGGDITYHGPGQLVGYPILDLKNQQKDWPNPSRYLRQLEQTIIDTLAHFHINGWRYPNYTGVWVHQFAPLPEPRKIAAIGVKFNGNGVSSHGFSLNVSPNMAHFDGIIPCGITEHSVTSMAQLTNTNYTVQSVLPHYIGLFAEIFNFDLAIEGIDLAN